MTRHRCDSCSFRKKYETRPGSLLGRLWLFHTRFCPGWRRYLAELPENERREVIRRSTHKREKRA
ncbi:MAG: hypothetical protein V2J11_00615 [Desulfofustis sp.]|jgi:hypothetical protein|nr:hypothetical protein [Desulfofustis sp.]